jgi:hypothetical protein
MRSESAGPNRPTHGQYHDGPKKTALQTGTALLQVRKIDDENL